MGTWFVVFQVSVLRVLSVDSSIALVSDGYLWCGQVGHLFQSPLVYTELPHNTGGRQRRPDVVERVV